MYICVLRCQADRGFKAKKKLSKQKVVGVPQLPIWAGGGGSDFVVHTTQNYHILRRPLVGLIIPQPKTCLFIFFYLTAFLPLPYNNCIEREKR